MICATAKKQRDVILIDIRKASAAADTGDQRAGATLLALARVDAAAGRLVSSVEASVVAAENRLAMAMNQVAVIEAKSHAMAPPCDGDAVRWFEVRTPDGRVIRHRVVARGAAWSAAQGVHGDC
jgi:hypothetical protein